MPATVYFGRSTLAGGLGNALFQYFAARVVSHLLQAPDVRGDRTSTVPADAIVIDDQRFIDLVTWHLVAGSAPAASASAYYVSGYFQRLDCLVPFRSALKQYWAQDGQVALTADMSVADLSPAAAGDGDRQDDELVMHVRLGDFLHEGPHNTEVIHPDDIKRALGKIAFGRLTIVCPPPASDVERRYLDCFAEYKPRLLSRSASDDFNYMRRARKLLLSCSTFAHAAAFLSDATEIYCYFNYRHGGDKGPGQFWATGAPDAPYRTEYQFRYWPEPMAA